MLEGHINKALAGHDGYRAIQALPGVGPVLAAVFTVEIGDVTRFPAPEKLTCWAGLTPRHRESDTTVHRGRITKQGSKLVRWAAIEAISRQRGGTFLQMSYRRIAERRDNRNIGRVAAYGETAVTVDTSHPGVLRPARRRDPLPGPPRRVNRIGRSQTRARPGS